MIVWLSIGGIASDNGEARGLRCWADGGELEGGKYGSKDSGGLMGMCAGINGGISRVNIAIADEIGAVFSALCDGGENLVDATMLMSVAKYINYTLVTGRASNGFPAVVSEPCDCLEHASAYINAVSETYYIFAYAIA